MSRSHQNSKLGVCLAVYVGWAARAVITHRHRYIPLHCATRAPPCAWAPQHVGGRWRRAEHTRSRRHRRTAQHAARMGRSVRSSCEPARCDLCRSLLNLNFDRHCVCSNLDRGEGESMVLLYRFLCSELPWLVASGNAKSMRIIFLYQSGIWLLCMPSHHCAFLALWSYHWAW